MVHLYIPTYEVGHPILIIAQHWPCWLSPVISLSLPLEGVFAQARFIDVFAEPSQVKLRSSWTSLENLQSFRNCAACNVLGSGSAEFLKELPDGFVHQSVGFIYIIELDFRRFRRRRDFDRKIQALVEMVWGMGLEATVVHHEEFGGVTNASYVIASRGFDTSCFHARDGLPRTLGHVINAASPGSFTSIAPPAPVHAVQRGPILVDGLLQRQGLYDVHLDRPLIACPSVFHKSRWVKRQLSSKEVLRMWDIPPSLDGKLDIQDIDSLSISASPLLISSFLRELWARGEASSADADEPTNAGSFVKEDTRTPPPSAHTALEFDLFECKGRLAKEDSHSTDSVGQVAGLSQRVTNDSDTKPQCDQLVLVKQLHDEAKAVKSDDAEVPVHLWDKFIMRGEEVSTKLARQLASIRQAALLWYRRKLTRDCLEFLKSTHGCWAEERQQRKGDHKLVLDLLGIREIVRRACNNSWFEYGAGSRLHFFRFPSKYRTIARDGVPVFFKSPGPTTILPQHNMAAAERDVLRKKVLSMWQKRYLDKPAGKLKSAISYFAVPKGEAEGVVQDWRVVFHAGANGLNDCVWAPPFWLPSVDSLLRIVDESSFMEDRDVGEMFLNFELHPSVRLFAGVDVKPLGFTHEECPNRWLWWTKNLMGFRSSPYNSVKMYLIAEEVIRGDRADERNPFRWHHVDLNLPGSKDYTPSKSWISKRRKDDSLASDIVVFVDDKRLAASGQLEVNEAGHRCSTREAYLGVQDALRKWRSAGGTQKPGAWAGVVVHVDPDRGVMVLTSQEKWDKLKRICRYWYDLLQAGETDLDYKRLQSDRGFMVYVAQAYPAMKPYLKGFHLSLETWRGGRDEEGWKIRMTSKTAESDDLPSRDEIEMEADEGDLAASESDPKAGPESGITMAVPRFQTDLEALLLLTESDTPRIRVVRNTRIYTALYGFGDASSDGFGATIERKSGVVGRYGLWATDISSQSSNFRELLNLVETIEEEGAAGSLSDTEIWLFTDNVTAEGCFIKGSSSSPLLHALVLRLRKLEMDHGLVLFLVHVAGTRMIAQGTDGLSRGLLLEGVLSGKDMLSFVDIAKTALERQPSLVEYIQSWTQVKLQVLTPNDWFTVGHGITGGRLNDDDVWIPTHAKNGMHYLWSPPPVIADVALEEALKAIHKRNDAVHIFVIPRLFSPRWMRLFYKMADFVFKLPLTSPFWPAEMHEPLFIGISLPYSRYPPWSIRGTPLLVDMERELRQMLSTGKGDGRDILRELLRIPSRLACVPEHVARGMLRMPRNRSLPDVSEGRR